MKILLLPLLMTVLGQGNDDPAALVKAMEEKIAKAASLQVDFDGKIESSKGNGTIKGSLVVSGNRGRMVIDVEMMDKKAFKAEIVTNGSKSSTTLNGTPLPLKDAPKFFREGVTVALARASVAGAFVFMRKGKEDDQHNPLEEAKMSDFKKLKTEKVGNRPAVVIQYKLATKEAKVPLTGTVWIDTKTNLPLKHTLQAEVGQERITATETYSNFRINPKIEGNPFELPK